ncbi:hypothetical protein ACJX0J_030427, partial [Zea mays]
MHARKIFYNCFMPDKRIMGWNEIYKDETCVGFDSKEKNRFYMYCRYNMLGHGVSTYLPKSEIVAGNVKDLVSHFKGASAFVRAFLRRAAMHASTHLDSYGHIWLLRAVKKLTFISNLLWFSRC